MSQIQVEEVLRLPSPKLSALEKVPDVETTLREIGRALGFLKSNPDWWSRIYSQCFQVVNAMAKAKEPQPQLCNLLQGSFELALSVDKDIALKLAGEEADAFMCLLQKAIDFTPPGHKSRAHFMQILMDVAIHSHVFPRILTLDDITDRSEHPLYAGGFGDVWRASWRGRSVALKSPRLTLVVNDSERAHRNLCREVLLWRQLNHPHLLEFLGVCKYSSPYTSIVSPWMENGTVLNFVQTRPKVGRIKLLKQVASALSYLHEHDPPVVHQDVRCINILVNDKQEAVLGDFGLSRIDNNFFTSMASTMQHGCTRWQAPELLFPPPGEIPSTSWATDMWSFGMVVLELFTECLPFAKTAVDSAVIIDIYHGRKPDRPVDSEVKAPGLSDRVWACVERCWAKSPSDRPRASVLVSQLAEELAAENAALIDEFSNASGIEVQGLSDPRDESVDGKDAFLGYTFKRFPASTPIPVVPLRRSVRARRRAPSREPRIAFPTLATGSITTTGSSKLPSPQLGSQTSGPVEESSIGHVCSNCATQNTPLWRYGPSGRTELCNACGLFYKLHGVVRPLSLKTDVIKKRTKQTARKSTGGKAARKQLRQETPTFMSSHHSDDASPAIPSTDLVQRPLLIPRSPPSEEALHSVIAKGKGVERPTSDFRQAPPMAKRRRTSKFACMEPEVDDAMRPSHLLDYMRASPSPGNGRPRNDDVSPNQREVLQSFFQSLLQKKGASSPLDPSSLHEREKGADGHPHEQSDGIPQVEPDEAAAKESVDMSPLTSPSLGPERIKQEVGTPEPLPDTFLPSPNADNAGDSPADSRREVIAQKRAKLAQLRQLRKERKMLQDQTVRPPLDDVSSVQASEMDNETTFSPQKYGIVGRSVYTGRSASVSHGAVARPLSAVQTTDALVGPQISRDGQGAFTGFSVGHLDEISSTGELHGQSDTSGQAAAANVDSTVKSQDQTSVPLKRSRGRPGGSKKRKADDSDADGPSEPSEPMKKKRGRPPKLKYESEHPTPKRPRGRPPKPKHGGDGEERTPKGRRVRSPRYSLAESSVFDRQESAKIYPDMAGPSISPIYSPISPHYAPTQPNYAPTPTVPSSPNYLYSFSVDYTSAAQNVPPSLPKGGSSLVQEDHDDLNFRQPSDIPDNEEEDEEYDDWSFQLPDDFTPDLALSFETEDSVIFIDIPKVHFHGVVGENSCNIMKLAELHGVTITYADNQEAGTYTVMKLQGSSVDTQRAKEEISKLIEFQELFGAFIAGNTCI